MNIIISENGKAKIYDDTYDIVIHCESEADHKKAVEELKNFDKYKKMWNKLNTEVTNIKRDQKSVNRDYYTGFVSALSNVEGIMAMLELEEDK